MEKIPNREEHNRREFLKKSGAAVLGGAATVFGIESIQSKESTDSPTHETARELETLKALFSSFETTYDLEVLHAITTRKEALESASRDSAKEDLKPIVRLLDTLETKAGVSKEEYTVLREQYNTLSRAVGMINNGQVDHSDRSKK